MSSPTYGTFPDLLAGASLSRECEQAITSVKAKPVADKRGLLKMPSALSIGQGATLVDEVARALHDECSGRLGRGGLCACRCHTR